MNKILIKSAIKNDSVFKIKRISSNSDYNVDGRISFLKLEKIKLSDYNLEQDYSEEIKNNPIVRVSISYINLSQEEANISILENTCKLMDLDDFSYKVFSVKGYGFPIGTQEEVYKIFNINSDYYGYTEFIPKIKYVLDLFFLVPEEETDYYFSIENGIVEEI